MDKEQIDFVRNLAKYDFINEQNSYGEISASYLLYCGDQAREAEIEYQKEKARLSSSLAEYRVVALTSERIGERYALHEIAYNHLMTPAQISQYKSQESDFLEKMYADLGNAGPQPSDYYGHSPSVGDALVILSPEKDIFTDGDYVGFTNYYVASWGFVQEVDVNSVMTREQQRMAMLGMTVREEMRLLEDLKSFVEKSQFSSLRQIVDQRIGNRLNVLCAEYEPVFRLADRRAVMEHQTADQAFALLAKHIDDFMYDNDPYGYRDDVGLSVEERSDHRAHLEDVLRKGAFSPLIDTIRDIRDSYQDATEEIFARETERATYILNALEDMETYIGRFVRGMKLQGDPKGAVETIKDNANQHGRKRTKVNENEPKRTKANENEPKQNMVYGGRRIK